MGRFTDLFQHADATPAPKAEAPAAPAPEAKKVAKTTKKK